MRRADSEVIRRANKGVGQNLVPATIVARHSVLSGLFGLRRTFVGGFVPADCLCLHGEDGLLSNRKQPVLAHQYSPLSYLPAAAAAEGPKYRCRLPPRPPNEQLRATNVPLDLFSRAKPASCPKGSLKPLEVSEKASNFEFLDHSALTASGLSADPPGPTPSSLLPADVPYSHALL
jgi:hypothetical protein